MGDAFKALSDPTRRKILELLKDETLNAGEIADYFHITKPSISHHLAILKNSGLIIDERQGQNILYSIDMTIFQDMMKWFIDFTDKGDIIDEEESF
ncbi:MAG: autorepressor SdpR family transcription factor [Coprobacillus sp.]